MKSSQKLTPLHIIKVAGIQQPRSGYPVVSSLINLKALNIRAQCISTLPRIFSIWHLVQTRWARP